MLDSIFSWWDSNSRSAEPSGSSGINRHSRQVNDSLCELHRPESIPSVQVVLFHGLQKSGDYTNAHWSTWQSEDASCIWPKTWLTEDIPGAHVLSVTYSGALRKISDGGQDLYIIGENLLTDILQLQQHTGQASHCPLVLVGHSIGGIVIKQLCCQAHDKLYSSRGTEMRKLEAFLKNIKGIFFYSTPHHGSPVAKRFAKNIRLSPLMTYFTALSTDAARLSNKFDNIWKWRYKWWLFAGLGETLRTNLGLFDVVVAPEASTRGENFNLVEGADHFSVCRPRSKSVRSFLKFKDFVNGIANEVAAVVHEEDAHFQDNDGFYIPIGNMQAEVFTEIEKGPVVVLVHGGVGKGKTTLARYVCEYYRQQKEVGAIFEYVHLELCGYGSGPDDALSKMRNVMRSLYPTSLDDSSDKTESGWRSRIASAFHKFLRENRVLIILDNVLDKRFLYEMWKVAQGCAHVKYLVTSQLPNLCHNLSKSDTHCIAMRRPTEDEAQKILATRAGMESGIIPSHLQPIIDQIITATEGNPQALACLAEHFSSSGNITDVEAWQDVYKNLPTVLNAVENTVVLGLHYESPRRSLWAAMDLCIKSLETSDAKVILFLIYACQRARISEEVLQIWYNFINTSVCTFLKSRDELHSRELLEPHFVEMGYKGSQLEGEDWDEKPHISTEWCLRPLVKLYMEHHMAGKNDMIMRDEIMDVLFGVKNLRVGSGTESEPVQTMQRSQGEEAKVAVVLCALHFDSSHFDHVVTDIAMRARSASKVEDLDCNWIYRRSEAIEPLVWLLGHPKHKERAKLVFSARKVFLTYICERQLDGDSFSTLLKLDAYPPVQLATLRALLSIFTVEETALPWQHARRTLMAVLALLDSNGSCSTSVQGAASKALVPMLEILFRFLSQHSKPNLRLQAASALIALTFGDGKKIVKEDRAVAAVVKSWSQRGKGDLQELLVGTVKDLASTESDSGDLALVNEEGVLAALGMALLEHNNRNMEKVAVEALLALTYGHNPSIKSKIANEEGAIAGLVMCLSAQDSPDLQMNAGKVLVNLSCSDDATGVAIMNVPGVLAALVKVMSKNDNDQLQFAAAWFLVNLTTGGRESDWMRIKILNEDGAISALVKALSTHDKPLFQEKSTLALSNLANGNGVMKEAIANDSRAIPGLVKLLSEHNKGASRTNAAKALRSLVAFPPDEKIRQKIGCEVGALAGLVKCLSEHDKPDLQEQAVATLHNLALTQDNTLKLKIRNENGLLTALVSLSQHKNPVVQQCVMALQILGEMMDEPTRKLWLSSTYQ